MKDYETSYQEYKQSLLDDHWFMKTLHEKYRNSIIAEKDYIDENGVFWKIGGLGAICGFCLAFTPIENGNWILGIALFLIIIGSIKWARIIESKFKKQAGETNFYAFLYHRHFKDRIQEDKDSETKKLLEDMLKAYEYSRFHDNIARLTKEDLEVFLLRVIKDTDEFKQRYQELSKYDSFAGSLRNDYYFNAEVQKDIDKYV